MSRQNALCHDDSRYNAYFEIKQATMKMTLYKYIIYFIIKKKESIQRKYKKDKRNIIRVP